MSYFSNMPVINYPIKVNGKPKVVNARNILVRAKFLDYVKDTQSAYLTYTIRDGERPDTLSNRVYGRPDLHWVILLFNEIINPMFEWPLSSHDLQKASEDKYRGRTLFIDSKRTYYGSSVAPAVQANEELWYEPGQTVTKDGVVGVVKSWDPDLYKVVIEETVTGGTFTPTENVDSVTNETRDLVHARSDGIYIYAPLGRYVSDNLYAVHHFENLDDGMMVDHHSLLTSSSGELIQTSILDRYTVTGTDVFSLADMTVKAVTNYEYAVRKNEELRTIKMLRPEMMDIVVKDMRRVFGE